MAFAVQKISPSNELAAEKGFTRSQKRPYRLLGTLATAATVVLASLATLPPANAADAPTGAAAAVTAPAPCSVTVKPGTEIATVVNARAAGDVICISAGTHSVSKTISPKANQELRGAAGAILDGSVPLTAFTAVKSTPARWQIKGFLPAAYTGPGQCEAAGSTSCNFAEDVFYDGRRLTRVDSLAAVTAGKFFGDYASNTITIAENPAGHAVRMSRTPLALSSVQSGVKLNTLTFQHFASRSQRGAVVVSGKNWLVKGNTIKDNHGVGLLTDQATSPRIEGNVISGNGQLGMTLYRSKDAVVTRNTVKENNLAGYWIADWESGGIKGTYSSATVHANSVLNNRGVGIWGDVEMDNMVITSNTIAGNYADGVRYEISRNGQIRNNIVTDNARKLGRGGGTGIMSGAGINVNTSSNVVITGNKLKGNLNGIGLQNRNRGAGSWGTHVLSGVSVNGNAVDMATGSPATATTGIVRDASRTLSAAGNKIAFSNNSYTLASTSQKSFNITNSLVTVQGWRNAGFDSAAKLSYLR